MSRSVDNSRGRVASAASNMGALLDDIIKSARKSFKATGDPGLDAKFLRECVGSLRELYALADADEGTPQIDDGIVIRLENQLEEWSK